MQASINNKAKEPIVGNVIMFLMLGFAVLGMAIAALVLLGWMPLGERANILRSNLNPYEIITIIASVIYAVACLRTVYGIRQGDSSSQRWAQWMSFISSIIGGVVLLSVIIPVGLKFVLLLSQNIDLRTFIDEEIGAIASMSMAIGEGLILVSVLLISLVAILALLTFLIPPLESLRQTPGIKLVVAPPRRFVSALFLVFGVGIAFLLVAAAFAVPEFPGVTKIRDAENHRLLAGLLFLIPALLAYLQVRQVEEESDELRRAIALTPGKFIRSELAKSPSAGAIIGFIAIFMGFTMATDLFLEPSSIASFLSNVATKGIIAIGVTYLMISGEFDLSVGSILGVTALSFMLFMTEGAPFLGILEPFPAALLALFVAFILGAINGILLITTRIPSFIVTLGTLLAYRAITLVAIAGGRILRYKDYYSEFPIIHISNMVFVVLAIVGLIIIAYTAYRVLPTLYNHATHAWSIRANNGDFGTTSAIVRSLYLVIVSLALFASVMWLFAVISYHLGSNSNKFIFVLLQVLGLLITGVVGFFTIRYLFRATSRAWSVRAEKGIVRVIVPGIALLVVLRVAWLIIVSLVTGIIVQINAIVIFTQVGFFDLVNGRVESIGSEGSFFIQIPQDANVRLAILWWFAFVVIFHIILTNTSFGNSIFATGGNQGAARAQGINVDRVKVQNFVLVAILTGIAAIYETARNPGVDPLKGDGWELEVIAMTVIGGALLTGGYGSVVGSLLGALIFGMLQTGLVLVGIESRLFTGTVGVIIIAAVVLNTFVRGARRD